MIKEIKYNRLIIDFENNLSLCQINNLLGTAYVRLDYITDILFYTNTVFNTITFHHNRISKLGNELIKTKDKIDILINHYNYKHLTLEINYDVK